MRIFIAKLVALVLFFSFSYFLSDQHAAKNITNRQIVLTSSVTPAEQLAENPQSNNSKDLRKTRTDFVTAGYLFVDTVEETAQYAGAGHPPLYLWRGAEKNVNEFREKGIILGQFADAQYQKIMFDLKPKDRLFLYTDGIVEASRAAGEMFGFERLKAFMKTHEDLPADAVADTFIEHLFNWSGKHTEKTLDDDLTLIVVDYQYGRSPS